MASTPGLTSTLTPIPGLVLLDLPVHGDNRGWFKENWQREKMVAVGLPDFGPVQNNISFNGVAGTTRGIHAEPWDKFVSVASGKIFGAWVDLRDGPTFGAVFTAELGPSRAVFVPYGVGNSYQTLENETAYSYLVNDHWSANASYTFLNLADETVGINWPIPLSEAELSEKDRAHPRLSRVTPMQGRKTLVIGSGGQLGKALRHVMPNAEFVSRAEFDVSNPKSYSGRHWRDYEVIVNASAYTKVDAAETESGRRDAWGSNVIGTSLLAAVASRNGITLVHVSSDYVFDGALDAHSEDEAFSPLGVYGQTKAAADAIVATVPRHYIVRTSWVIGEGTNFVRTMASLAARGIAPSVVNDQIGRLTFTDDIALGIVHLLNVKPSFGTYNLTNDGESRSWAQLASRVYEILGHDPMNVTGVSTQTYFEGKDSAPRPLNSTLTLDKIKATGFTPRNADDALLDYLIANQ
ncbi:sugar nucleotide-binding protein [Subtercola frigoramans]|uniref:dTDP-4-dehydrorhamnose reductase n=1 Tax=Subtercola frigoramans TaxID=120298 RepID=A0ABS2L8J1_9MICO|nr:bifunctional dTDP-4-dehydrorhamnose 3,5-epimerase family protein/NAD(P)-dependent oxidoreductase [Subtercola frigoramans]MBM7473412.1 dTDP-4-dehydrorhamnose 3,5-epimerase [Subtercola frigoramans]